MKSIQDCRVLKNGVKIPCVGFGTWKISDEEAKEQVLAACQNGYRHIDTAAFYKNETGIGDALRHSNLAREELFLTSKVWNEDQGYQECKKAFQKSLEKLGTDYLDLYLIHWPVAYNHRADWERSIIDTWKAMEELYQDGKIKAIGVCNFMPHHFKPLLEQAAILPMVDQIELHPGMPQKETLAFCNQYEIQVEAWAPLARQAIFDVQKLQYLAKKYSRSIAQITLRWELQKGVIPLPKSSNPARMLENSQIFDFKLSSEDMEQIETIIDCEGSGQHPDHITF